MSSHYHSLKTIMENAKQHQGNKEPKPERISIEAEREKLLPSFKRESHTDADATSASSTEKS